MAFLKNLQDISSSITATIVTASEAGQSLAHGVKSGADAFDKVMQTADLHAGKTFDVQSIKVTGAKRREEEALYKEFPELRPEGVPTPEEAHRAEEANEPVAVAA